MPISSTSNTYTFSGLNSGTTYTIKVYVVDSEGYSSDTSSLNVETDNGVLLADYIKSLYTSQGSNGIFYHSGSLAYSARDNSYRYAGSNVNNYVCFGSDASTCPSDNLYRIIGVFGSEVKLIKSTSYGNYKWDSSDNTWSSSDIRGTLNNAFLGAFNSVWQNKIANHNWKVGGIAYSSWNNTPQNAYNYEVGNNSSNATNSAKIGLMYVSDYGYAVSNDYWTQNLDEYDNSSLRNNNWMYSRVVEWTISRNSESTNSALLIDASGAVGQSVDFSFGNSNAIRPCFYLNSNVTYISGSGTSTDPIRLGD